MNKKINRKQILEQLIGTLKPLDYVYALWEGGAAAFNRVDDWSDIDLQVDVEDDKVEAVFDLVEKSLQELSPIQRKLEMPQPAWHGHYQTFYKLEGTSEFLVIDFVVMKHSNPNKFLEKEIHGNTIFHLQKKGMTPFMKLDNEQFKQKLDQRLLELNQRFQMFQFLVQKEFYRDNYIEALEFYYRMSLDPLVEILRIKYKPYHYNFRTRYVYYDLPEEIVEKLEGFYFIPDKKELLDKHQEVISWFNQLMKED